MSQSHRLTYLLLLNLAMIIGLVSIGLTARSLGVLAAGGDFIADSLAILLGLIAVHLRDKHSKHQAPTFVALINSLMLLSITVFVLIQALHRLFTHSPEVHGLPVLIVSAISTVVMFTGALILGKGAGNEDLHMRSVLLDTISDGVSAAAVAVVGAIMFFSRRLYWLDAVVAVGISLVIGVGAIRLLVDVAKALRSGQAIKVDDD